MIGRSGERRAGIGGGPGWAEPGGGAWAGGAEGDEAGAAALSELWRKNALK